MICRGKFNLSMTSDKARNRGPNGCWPVQLARSPFALSDISVIDAGADLGGLFRKTDKVSIQPCGLTAQNLAAPFAKTVLKIDSEFLLVFDEF